MSLFSVIFRWKAPRGDCKAISTARLLIVLITLFSEMGHADTGARPGTHQTTRSKESNEKVRPKPLDDTQTDDEQAKPVQPYISLIEDQSIHPGGRIVVDVDARVPKNPKASGKISFEFSPKLETLPGKVEFNPTYMVMAWKIPEDQPISSFTIAVTAVYRQLKSTPVRFQVTVLPVGEAVLVSDNNKVKKITDLSKALFHRTNARVVLSGGKFDQVVTVDGSRDVIIECVMDRLEKKTLFRGILLKNSKGIVLRGCNLDAGGSEVSPLVVEGSFDNSDSVESIFLRDLNVHGSGSGKQDREVCIRALSRLS